MLLSDVTAAWIVASKTTLVIHLTEYKMTYKGYSDGQVRHVVFTPQTGQVMQLLRLLQSLSTDINTFFDVPL